MKITTKNNIIETSNGKKYEKPSKLLTIGAIAAANTAGCTVVSGASNIAYRIFQKQRNKITQLDNDFFKLLSNVFFEKSGLKEKGTRLIDAATTNKKDIFELYEKISPMPVRKTQKFKNILNTFIDGKNALFNPKGNFILVNKDKIAIALPHEIGHALNSTGKGLGKILSETRTPFRLLTSLALLTALFKRKKIEGEKPKNTWDKSITFVKNNCGKVALLGVIPTLSEEALASIKGYKLAKASGTAEQVLQKLAKFQGQAFATHLITALGTVLATIVISKVRDEIAKPKEIK